MIYTFRCDGCEGLAEFNRTMTEGPPEIVVCPGCDKLMYRNWKADSPMIDTSMCQDHSDIPEQHRVLREHAPSNPAAEEAKFQRAIDDRRKLRREAGDSSIRQTHMFPPDLYHGKVRQTGDNEYWKDPKNLRKHKDCEI